MNYIIITPAYNEEKYINQTINSVLSQSILPQKWIIVDDGSNDNTAYIIKEYAKKHEWIKYQYRTKVMGQSYYASNVHAIIDGLKVLEIEEIPYDYIAILDADIELPCDYYEQILTQMESKPELGIASGNCADRIGNKLKKHLYDRRSCAKAIMVFRKDCFDQIGGFVPMKYGGEDTVACFMARMRGWRTWAYHEMLVEHNKPLGTGPSRNIIKVRFRQGVGEYSMGSHPLFVLFKSLRRCVKEPPYILGGFARLWGFIYAHFIGEPRQISEELIKYIRKEQFGRVCQGNKIPKEHQLVESYEKH
ncbi:MAG TPA: glycosyltransferase family A protein [Anaerohalosphaeraceae bacterium]|nr:glycosyltransferase family A protein [Anaerohalosphaeraceae bacterium]